MKTQIEFLVFGAIATTLHAAGFLAAPETGQEAGGEQGAYMVTLQGATPQIEQLIEDWNTEPDPVQQTQALQDIETPADAPQIESREFAVLNAPQAPVHLPRQEKPVTPDVQQQSVPDIKPPTRPAQTAPRIASPQVSAPAAPKINQPTPIPQVDDAPKINTETAPPPRHKPKPRPKKKADKAKAKKPTTQKAKKARKAVAAQPDQKAAGQGGGASAGSSGKAKIKSGNKAKAAKALNVWGAQIRRAVERKKRSVRGLKRRSRAVVSVTVSANGQLLGFRLSKTSGNKKADNAALRAVNSVGRLPRAVKGVAVRKHTFNIPIVFNP